LDTIHRLKTALGQLDEFRCHFHDNHQTLIQDLTRKPPQFVLNLCDEGYRNQAVLELHVPAILEMLNIPYTGAGPNCLSICYNKAMVRAVAQSLDVDVPQETYFDPNDQAATLPSYFPALLKPNTGDSSIGITQNAVVHNARELIAYLEYLRELLPGVPVLIQEYLQGREFSVGLIGNPDKFETLPILEVDYSDLPEGYPHILSYESKWHPESPYWTCIRYKEAHLEEEPARRIVDFSRRLFERLECRDYARFDFRADANGCIKLLEVNPNPGWCWDGKLNLMAGFAGIEYPQLIGMILNAARDRCGLLAPEM
jgi:D-alanine-D-alanine ligase